MWSMKLLVTFSCNIIGILLNGSQPVFHKTLQWNYAMLCIRNETLHDKGAVKLQK